ncbi:MAG TPA: hypothetical protein VN937_14135 [Blastocatellia bacterium]|nr:hypothetical protein [Blastocatellia bacterium]
MDAYKNDLAYIHDAGFGDFSRASAPWLLETLRQNGIDNGLVAISVAEAEYGRASSHAPATMCWE